MDAFNSAFQAVLVVGLVVTIVVILRALIRRKKGPYSGPGGRVDDPSNRRR